MPKNGEGHLAYDAQLVDADANGGGLTPDDAHDTAAPADPLTAGQVAVDTQAIGARRPGDGHPGSDAHRAAADSGPLISEIRGWHRQRVFAMEQRKRADLALGSFLRTALGWSRALPDADRKRINSQAQDLISLGEAEAKGKSDGVDEPAYIEWRAVILAAIASRAPFDAIEKQAKTEMANLAKQLPVYSLVETIRGFGEVSLAIIVAEAGDLSNYATPSKLWKRMGLAVMDGVRQGGLSKSAAKDDWIEHGYNRLRRSRMWNIGDALIRGNGDGEYRAIYLARKEYERQRALESGLTVAPAAKIPAKRASEFMSDGHIHRRAQRYMEKRLLRDLWQAWRRASLPLSPSHSMPAPKSKRTGQLSSDNHRRVAGAAAGHADCDTQI
jgi:hypothetical protein